MNNVYLVRRNSSEYHYMWLMLGQHPLNSELKGAVATRNDPTVAFHEGEAWEYTVTGIQDGKMCHCFRHRNHPKTKQREYVLIPVSDKFSIEKDCDLNRKPKLKIYRPK